jgi:2-oxoglutarate/2-oxoacid ferredoxin oxidoreductase subunit beta
MLNETMSAVYTRPLSMTPAITHYCPGCTHGVIQRLVAEVLDELNLREKTIGVASVGCSVFVNSYFNCDFVGAPHGRAPATATGVKRVQPDKIVFTYQGDGDLAAIGTGEIIHAASRGENITVIFVNNAVYGMTGGQMAPTTLPGMRTTSSPSGRDVETMGFPVRVSELLSTLSGASYIVRRSVHDPGHISQTKKAIRKAFEVQMNQMGFAMVEILSACPVNWNMQPAQALEFIKNEMIPYYPLGDYKIRQGVG